MVTSSTASRTVQASCCCFLFARHLPPGWWHHIEMLPSPADEASGLRREPYEFNVWGGGWGPYFRTPVASKGRVVPTPDTSVLKTKGVTFILHHPSRYEMLAQASHWLALCTIMSAFVCRIRSPGFQSGRKPKLHRRPPLLKFETRSSGPRSKSS